MAIAKCMIKIEWRAPINRLEDERFLGCGASLSNSLQRFNAVRAINEGKGSWICEEEPSSDVSSSSANAFSVLSSLLTSPSSSSSIAAAGFKKAKSRRPYELSAMKPGRNGAMAGTSTTQTADSAPKIKVADRLSPFGETIFTTMSELAKKHNAVNLGQGFPNFDGPEFVKEAAVAAIREGKGQYSRLQGVPELNTAIAERFKKDYGIVVNPDEEVTVTCGCTGALSAAFLGLINPGDEVILIEPYYDSYRACVAMAGGIAKFVTLRPPSFSLNKDELRAAFSPRTKAIVVNSPHNPTGRVFSMDELEAIAALCKQHNAIVFSDQVYEKLVFPGTKFTAMATLPGMYERTVSMSSVGKTYSLTGWKIGWAVAPRHLTMAIRRAHQFLTFSVCTPMQWGTLAALQAPEDYYSQVVSQYVRRKGILVNGLRDVGFKVFEPEGSFFVMADHTPFRVADNDVAFCQYLIKHVGVAAIPPSSFYSDPAEGKNLVRFAFCKDENTLLEALSRMKAKLSVPGKNLSLAA